ncbi:single-stranded-DNA-specific exonuclease RecJ [Propionivibrio sp.]|uniref:single-stranded-DNA-specific exonuclease RecJ n=1 Tax=Propionivibrio sp. TaxID=2212460 RepID=UPI0025DAD04A|nr:single-stranded-DNA-specific exonuclease RecJ [Propionivibrio sp.]MBK7355912.1 single-stranded-DNA-specific exonuclease RecJ [Propionivibrio sp.]MBK8743887.1 single-stranded-DNA-specific exonuclease RecJ [Propionivibrio sp.]MBK8895323.1 single-stranded-DNA-specific exonuclease RecJ [Propionivibrio sp.]
MTRLKARTVPPRIQWQLEQQGLHPLLARIYAARGIQTRNELDYALKHLLSPTLLTHADQAATLLADAIEAAAKILIVADYDCDGATACAVGIRALRALCVDSGAVVDYLVPNRFTYGYGLTPEIVDLAATLTPDLIVTVDNGIASIEGVARANELGIATLITDHHLPADEMPAADCIVNPNQPGCEFPSKSMAGVGVMFYVMLALRAELRERGWFADGGTRREPNLAALLDLVALGTVADVVKLDRNNRILVDQGLRRMREGKLSPGLRAIFRAAGRDPAKATSLDLGFIVGPRLNAAGRLADMSLGIECLISDDEGRALNIAQQLDALNRERKDIESGMQDQALSHLESIDTSHGAGIALFDPLWHQGVVGILASRIKDKQHRPVFVFARGETNDNGAVIKGSGRSIPGLHLRDALDLVSKRAPGLLLRFGGHAMAAGVTILEADFRRFRELFAQIAGELLSPADLTRTLDTDGPLEASYFSLATARLLENEVWGQGFPAPLFEDEFVVESQRILKEKHLKLRLRKGEQRLEAIQFNFSVTPGNTLRAAFRLAINEYQGVQTPQLMIEHIELLK